MRLDPFSSGFLLINQFVLWNCGLASAGDVDIFKHTFSAGIRKLASINILIQIEPAFQPITVWRNLSGKLFGTT